MLKICVCHFFNQVAHLFHLEGGGYKNKVFLGLFSLHTPYSGGRGGQPSRRNLGRTSIKKSPVKNSPCIMKSSSPPLGVYLQQAWATLSHSHSNWPEYNMFVLVLAPVAKMLPISLQRLLYRHALMERKGQNLRLYFQMI